MEKPNARGPSASRKAQVALGPKLNRKPKPPPTKPGGNVKRNRPAARRIQA